MRNRQKVLEFLRSIIDEPIKLGRTDCNSIAAQLLDIMHGCDIHERLTQNINRDIIRSNRASTELEALGYEKVEGSLKTGDFIIIPEKFWDSCLFCYAPMTVVSAFPRKIDKRNKKVRSMKLQKMPDNGVIYRCSK